MKKFIAKEKENYVKQKKQNSKRTFAMMMMAGATDRKKNNDKRVRFVVDSGASDHMVNNVDLLEDIRELERPVVISIAKSGEKLRATKVGRMKLKSVVGMNSIKNLELYNVLFTPGLEENLLSVRWASKSGKRVTFTKEEDIFEHEDEVVVSGIFIDGLFHLHLIWEGKSTESLECLAYVGKQVNLET